MNAMRRQDDGSWVPAEPLGPQGVSARVEFWLRERRRCPLVVRFLAWLDERGLG